MTTYSLTELTDQLEIPQSTIRRWCKALEDAGYTFQWIQNRRIYSSDELRFFKIIKAVMSSGVGMTLDDVCQSLDLKSDVEAPSIRVGEANGIKEAMTIFEEELERFPNTLYWHGATLATNSLRSAYEVLKKEIE